MPYFGAEPSSELANLDINGQKFILDADADTSITADTDDQIDIEIAGADDFSFKANTFEVQTGSNIDMNGTELILDANGNTSITADTDDQIDFKIAGADDFQMTANTFTVLSGSTLAVASGATIANSGTATGFGVSLANDGDNRVVTGTGSGGLNGEANLVFDGNKFFVADSANGNLTTGITINQGAADDNIFELKSSDIAHGVTGYGETDTWFLINKYTGTNGGAQLRSFSEADYNFQLQVISTGESTNDVVGSNSSCRFQAMLKDGTGVTAVGATGNMFSWHNEDDCRMLLKGNGVLHLTNTSPVAIDTEDDAMLIRTLDLLGTKEQTATGIIETQWDDFIERNDSKLKEIGVLSSENDFIAIQPWVKLANGAIWQQRAMFETMKQVVDKMLPGFSKKLNEELEAQSLPALPA